MIMSSAGSTNNNKRQASGTSNCQRALDNNDSTQHLKLRERQRFFEEVYQRDTDVYISSAHLQIDSRKPPIGSISSMEVNVDILEQMDLMDLTDQEALDVFLNSGVDDGDVASPLPDIEDEDEEDEDEDAEVVYIECGSLSKQREEGQQQQQGSKNKSRMSSTSSSSASSDTSRGGACTPVIQSDDEEVHVDTLLTSLPLAGDEETEEEEEEKCKAASS